MSSLNARLHAIKTASAEKVPAEVKATMNQATDALRASGILEGIPKPGDALPAFELLGTDGQPVRSGELLDKGPLVVTFYRGGW